MVCRQHRQIVAETQLRQERIDRFNPGAGTATAVSQLGSLNVILTVRDQERNGGKSIQNGSAALRTRKALQQLLQDQTCTEYGFPRLDGSNQRLRFHGRRR